MSQYFSLVCSCQQVWSLTGISSTHSQSTWRSVCGGSVIILPSSTYTHIFISHCMVGLILVFQSFTHIITINLDSKVEGILNKLPHIKNLIMVLVYNNLQCFLHNPVETQ